MILVKTESFTLQEIEQLKQRFEVYIKTVIDVEKKICCAGMDWHYEGEKMLLETGSSQAKIWGGGIDLETKTIDFNAFINIRPNDNNTSNEIQDAKIRKRYEELSKFFFSEIF